MKPIEIVVKDVTNKETADGIRSRILLKGSTETLDFTMEIRGQEDEIETFRNDLNLLKVGVAGLAITVDQYQKKLEDYEDTEGDGESVEDSDGKEGK